MMEVSDSYDSGKTKGTTEWRWKDVMYKNVVQIMCGLIYGFALHKAYAVKPIILQQQMYFRRVTLITFTLSAISISMLIMSVIAMLPSTNRLFMISCNKFYNRLSDKGILSSVLGGMLMGVGITVAGSTPSVIFAQIGAGVPNAGTALAGALLATLLYTLLKNHFSSVFKPSIKESSNPWANSPYFVSALPLVAMFGITACGFETLRPYSDDIKITEPQNVTLVSQRLWPSYMSGILIGLLQLPLLTMLHQTLGCYYGYRGILALLSLGRLPMFDVRGPQEGLWWHEPLAQVLYLLGVCGGGYTSALLSDRVGVFRGVEGGEAFCGGFLLLLGANIAGGCMSTHGISGMGLLSILSFITMSSVWLGGVTSAALLHWDDVYKFLPRLP